MTFHFWIQPFHIGFRCIVIATSFSAECKSFDAFTRAIISRRETINANVIAFHLNLVVRLINNAFFRVCFVAVSFFWYCAIHLQRSKDSSKNTYFAMFLARV